MPDPLGRDDQPGKALLDSQLDLDQVTDGGHQLHRSYRATAEANGVDPADPRLAPCRGEA